MHAVTLTIGLCSQRTSITAAKFFKESLIKSFDRLRTNGKVLIPLMVSLSNHNRNPLTQSFLNLMALRQSRGFSRDK